jgi:DNA (cytosine-5)-methyltransferase 3A
MIILSLFDGISGGRVALERANIPVDKYFASEVDPHAIHVAQKNYQSTIQIGDVSKVSYKSGVLYTENGTFDVGQIDLLVGGSPCQNFTFAGKREGMVTDTNVEITSLNQYLELKESGFVFKGQSYLFWEYIRLLREIKPKYFLLENVKMNKRWQSVITDAVGVSSVNINSELLSAQRRNRLYWTNINDGIIPQPNDLKLVLKDIVRVEDNDKYHLSIVHHNAFLKSYKWTPNYLTEKSKPLLASYYKQPPHCPYIPCEQSESGYRMLSPVECERLQTLPDDYTEGISKTQRYKCIGNGFTVNVLAYIFSYLQNKMIDV